MAINQLVNRILVSTFVSTIVGQIRTLRLDLFYGVNGVQAVIKKAKSIDSEAGGDLTQYLAIGVSGKNHKD